MRNPFRPRAGRILSQTLDQDFGRGSTYTYLGDWINQQKKAAAAGVAGADVRILAATELAAKLASIIAGEPPYDIFVRWKPLHQQPIGWEPDINDGVRLNIRPFIEAGVLRGKVNVNWKKDRGAEPQSLRPRKMFPWFWGWDEVASPIDFTGKTTGARTMTASPANGSTHCITQTR